jgi:hypothetical protein
VTSPVRYERITAEGMTMDVTVEWERGGMLLAHRVTKYGSRVGTDWLLDTTLITDRQLLRMDMDYCELKPVLKLSAHQRRVLRNDNVTLLGYDEAGRPVIKAMVGNPQQLRTWALGRGGDPVDVRGDVATCPVMP